MSQHSLKYVDRPDLVLTESIKKRYHRSDYVPLDKPKLADKTSTSAMARKASQKDLKQREIDSLIAVGDSNTLIALAKNESISESDLRKLSHDTSRYVRYQVLKNPKVPLDVIIKFTSDVHPTIAREAKDIMKDKDVLGDLLGESQNFDWLREAWKDGTYRIVQYNHPNMWGLLQDYDIPEEVYTSCLKASVPNKRLGIQQGLASNRNPSLLTSEAALKLATSKFDSVRKNLVENPMCPLSALIELTKDGEEFISKIAKMKLKERDVLGDLLGESAKYDPFDGLSIYEMADLAKVETNPEEIIKMYDASRDSKIDEAIASNKNTPSDIQKSLAGQVNYLVALALSNNPGLTEAAALRLVERNAFDPRTLVIAKNALRAVSLEKVMAMASAQNPLIAEIARKELKNNRDILGDLLNESKSVIVDYIERVTDPEELDRLFAEYEGTGSIRATIARNIHTSGSTLSKLCDDDLIGVRLTALRNKNTPIEALIKSLGDEDMDVAQRAKEELKERDVLDELLNENMSSEYIDAVHSTDPVELARIAESTNDNNRSQVALNVHTSVETLSKLASDPDIGVRRSVAYNPNTPIKILNFLSADPMNSVRWTVAENPKTPEKILRKLSKDPSNQVLGSLAENPSTPIDILLTLSKHDYEMIRYGVAKNKNAPIDIISNLMSDEDPRVAQEAKENLASRDILGDLLGESYERPEWIDREELERSHSTDPKIRRKAAMNSTSPEILIRLSKDKNKTVREFVAANTHIPKEAAEKLCTDHIADIRSVLAANPSTPAEILSHLASTGNIQIQCDVASNPSTSKETLEQLSRNGSNSVRTYVANNNATDIDTLVRMRSTTNNEYTKQLVDQNIGRRDMLSDLLGESKCYESFQVWLTDSVK